MKLLFKQRMFSWFDSYDIYDEMGNVVYEVKGQLSWGHCLKIFAPSGQELGTVKQQVLTWLPKFEVYEGNSYVGCISKELSFLTPRYHIDFNGWEIEGSFLEWDYSITGAAGERKKWRRGSKHIQGIITHDGYICVGYRKSGKCPACADVCAGH